MEIKKVSAKEFLKLLEKNENKESFIRNLYFQDGEYFITLQGLYCDRGSVELVKTRSLEETKETAKWLEESIKRELVILALLGIETEIEDEVLINLEPDFKRNRWEFMWIPEGCIGDANCSTYDDFIAEFNYSSPEAIEEVANKVLPSPKELEKEISVEEFMKFFIEKVLPACPKDRFISTSDIVDMYESQGRE